MGMLFVQMGRLEEAASSFEWVMRERAEFKAGLHAVLCHFALSHRDKMKRAFLELLDVQLNVDQEDKYSINPVSCWHNCTLLTKAIYFTKHWQHLHHVSQCQLITHKGAHISHNGTFLLKIFLFTKYSMFKLFLILFIFIKFIYYM